MKAKILFVDDDRKLLSLHHQSFGSEYSVDTAENVTAAFQAIETGGPYAAVLSDMNMPQMSGVELFAALTTSAPETVRIMVTAEAARQIAIDAVNRGQIFRFLTKPCRYSDLHAALGAAVTQYGLVRAERALLEDTLSASVKVLSEILSLVEPATFGRTQKLRRYVSQFHAATQLGVRWELDVAAMLAQIGLVTLHGSNRPSDGKRSLVETAQYASVPRIGCQLLHGIPRLENVTQIILYQAQRFDGGGALAGISKRGEAIPLGARILKVLADLVAYEAAGVSPAGAMATMEKRQPGCYDSKILMAARELFVREMAMPEGNPTRQLPLRDLKVGDVIQSDVLTNQGLLIVAAGAEVTQILLRRLQNFSESSGIREPIAARVRALEE